MHRKNFYTLLGTQTMANAADIMYITALVALVLYQTDSVVSAVLVPLLRVGAQMITSFLAPLLLERFQLPYLLFMSQAGQVALFGVLGVYLWTLPTGEAPQLVIVLGLVFAMSLLDGWTTPARNALVPRVAGRDELVKANTLISISDRIVQFAGWGVSGLLLALLGSSTMLLLAGSFYVLSLGFTLLLHDPLEHSGHYLRHPKTQVGIEQGAEAVHKPAASDSPDASSVSAASEIPAGSPGSSGTPGNRLHLLQEGFKRIRLSRRLTTLTFMDVVDMLGGSVWVGAFTLAYVQQVLHRGEEWWGFINGAYFAGTLAGGMLVLAYMGRIQTRLFPAMLLGMGAYAVLTALYAFNVSPAVALIIIILTGPATELSAITRRTLVQESVSDAELPKVLSAQNTVLNLVFCLSLLLLGWVADRFGVVPAYLVTAALSGSAVLFGYMRREAFRRPGPSLEEY
ncbi:MFS transporter [Paenibacillus sp. GCM10023252]|uniref:MFS transporter n=1 Tax=Paenibacillus sp. GCM10023252 TaxID=3252649 RepID=UPI00361B6C4A